MVLFVLYVHVYCYFEKGCWKKLCMRQSRKVIWDMNNALFLTLKAQSNLLLLLSFSTRKHTSMASCAILTNFFEKQWTQNHPQYLSGLLCALFPTTFLEIAIMYNHVHVVLSFESVDKILRCDLSNASPQVVILRGAICFSAFYM